MIFWRRTVRELAEQLDVIDELIHALVVALNDAEANHRDCCGHSEHPDQEGDQPDRFHVSGTPPPTPPPS